MKYGFIFDLDGVIVDTAKYHFLAWRRLARSLGFAFTMTDNERLKGVSRMKSLDILLSIGGRVFEDVFKDALAIKKNVWYREYISKMGKDEILPGAKELLVEVRTNGFKTALASASKNATTIINRLKIGYLFDSIVDGTMVTHAKPDPEVFLKAAEQIKVTPDNCLVFEDAEAGIEAAISAGMRSVGIGSSEILGNANMVVPSLENISIEQAIALLERSKTEN